MKRKIFPKEKGHIFSYIFISLLVSASNSFLQIHLFDLYVIDHLPVGWGGLAAPFVVAYLSFIITLPLTLIFFLFWPKTYYSALIDWKFLVLYLMPLVGVTLFIVYLVFPLDGGGSVLSRSFSEWF